MVTTELFTVRGGLRDAVGALRRPIRTGRKLVLLARDAVGGRLVRVPIRLCIDAHAFGYGAPGWHPHRALAEELRESPRRALADTRFARFVRGLHAPTYTDLMTLHDPELAARLPKLPHGSYPWGAYEWSAVAVDPRRFHDRTAAMRRRIEIYDRSQGVERALDVHATRILSILRSVERHGYRPLLGDADPVPTVGVLARRGSAEIRYVVKDRNHFLAVLAALGCTEAWVRIDSRRFPIVWEADVDRWPWVRSGLLRRADALTLFSLYFELDGTERARACGIPAGEGWR